MDDRAVRVARNEALFRAVNERIAEHVGDGPMDDAPFVCECSDPGCSERIHLALARYEEIRGNPTHFLVKPGHADLRYERVVVRGRGYEVVEKDQPDAARTAAKLDPRS